LGARTHRVVTAFAECIGGGGGLTGHEVLGIAARCRSRGADRRIQRAHLAGKEDDYPGAFRAIRRGCEIETRAPIAGDALFACEQYAELLISAGTARGGDPAKGVAMLEQMCKARPVSTSGDVSPCSTLAREYDKPPKASGLPRRTDKAAALQSAACDQGDAMACSALGDMLLVGGPGFPADAVKARAAMDRACAGTDHYAAGVCGSIGSMLAEGKLGGAPDRTAAMPYLSRSCAQGYRCDLYVEFLLRDGRDAEAVSVFDRPRSFFMRKDEWARKY
jgi:TPR repeat protein